MVVPMIVDAPILIDPPTPTDELIDARPAIVPLPVAETVLPDTPSDVLIVDPNAAVPLFADRPESSNKDPLIDRGPLTT